MNIWNWQFCAIFDYLHLLLRLKTQNNGISSKKASHIITIYHLFAISLFRPVILYFLTTWTTDRTFKRSNGDVGYLVRLPGCKKGRWKLSERQRKQFNDQVFFLKASGFFFISASFFVLLTTWTTDKTSKRSYGDVGHLVRLPGCEKSHQKLLNWCRFFNDF